MLTVKTLRDGTQILLDVYVEKNITVIINAKTFEKMAEVASCNRKDVMKVIRKLMMLEKAKESLAKVGVKVPTVAPSKESPSTNGSDDTWRARGRPKSSSTE